MSRAESAMKVSLLESRRHARGLSGSGKDRRQLQRRRASDQYSEFGRPNIPADPAHHSGHRARVARRQRFFFGGRRTVGREADIRLPAKILLRRNFSASQAERAARDQVHPCALGGEPLGPRDFGADVRIQFETARGAGRNSDRGIRSRRQYPGLKKNWVSCRLRSTGRASRPFPHLPVVMPHVNSPATLLSDIFD